MPDRTWEAIKNIASDFKVQRKKRQGLQDELMSSITWDDIAYFPDRAKAIEMAKEAITTTKGGGVPLYVKWLVTRGDAEVLVDREQDNMNHTIEHGEAIPVS